MNMKSNEQYSGDDRVEALLRRATPRPVPPADDEKAIREAVHAEWQAVVADRRSIRRFRQLAVAASVLVAAGALFMTLRQAGFETVEVASIEKSTGAIYLLGDRSELIEASDIASIHSSQVVVTGSESALGLAWGGGGSLRIDEDTRIEFVDETSVFLRRGRLYFDSAPAAAAGRLVVRTEHGDVTHAGTQFMAASDPDGLVVSVREGRVTIDGRHYEETAVEGKQIRIRGSERPLIVDLPGHGSAWQWVEAVSPGIDLDNRSAREFLEWVARETGHELVFDDPAAERIAAATRLVGKVEADPRTELRLRMMTTDLEYAFDPVRGTINVTVTEAARR